MNWVGGARSRVKVKQEKKLQQEFFERKRQEKRVKRSIPITSLSQGDSQFSQDLISLQTILKTHDVCKREIESDESIKSKRQPIYVDLDVSTPGRYTHNLDLGPNSPTKSVATDSKIILEENDGDQESRSQESRPFLYQRPSNTCSASQPPCWSKNSLNLNATSNIYQRSADCSKSFLRNLDNAPSLIQEDSHARSNLIINKCFGNRVFNSDSLFALNDWTNEPTKAKIKDKIEKKLNESKRSYDYIEPGDMSTDMTSKSDIQTLVKGIGELSSYGKRQESNSVLLLDPKRDFFTSYSEDLIRRKIPKYEYQTDRNFEATMIAGKKDTSFPSFQDKQPKKEITSYKDSTRLNNVTVSENPDLHDQQSPQQITFLDGLSPLYVLDSQKNKYDMGQGREYHQSSFKSNLMDPHCTTEILVTQSEVELSGNASLEVMQQCDGDKESFPFHEQYLSPSRYKNKEAKNADNQPSRNSCLSFENQLSLKSSNQEIQDFSGTQNDIYTLFLCNPTQGSFSLQNETCQSRKTGVDFHRVKDLMCKTHTQCGPTSGGDAEENWKTSTPRISPSEWSADIHEAVSEMLDLDDNESASKVSQASSTELQLKALETLHADGESTQNVAVLKDDEDEIMQEIEYHSITTQDSSQNSINVTTDFVPRNTPHLEDKLGIVCIQGHDKDLFVEDACTVTETAAIDTKMAEKSIESEDDPIRKIDHDNKDPCTKNTENAMGNKEIVSTECLGIKTKREDKATQTQGLPSSIRLSRSCVRIVDYTPASEQEPGHGLQDDTVSAEINNMNYRNLYHDLKAKEGEYLIYQG